jgi:RNA polymerase sigma-70 factor (ECF subfamily)
LSLDFSGSDSITIADLYDEYEDRLRRYAISLVGDSDRAEDLVQDTFIKAMSYLSLLTQLNRHQRQAWLSRVLKNRFLDEERARQRQRALIEQLTREQQIDGPPVVQPTMQELLQTVPERYRELLVQRYWLGMTSVEISRELAIPPTTVRSRLHLAIKWLRAHQSEFI